MNKANRTQRSTASPWRKTSQSHTSAIADFTEQLNVERTGRQRQKQRRPGKTIATSGREQRTLKTERKRRLLSDSADHTSQRDGSTEGVGRQAQFHHLTDVPMTNTSPLDNTSTLTSHRPGCGVTRVGPDRTPTVRSCPSRLKGHEWLNHARNKCTQ